MRASVVAIGGGNANADSTITKTNLTATDAENLRVMLSRVAVERERRKYEEVMVHRNFASKWMGVSSLWHLQRKWKRV